MLFNWGAHLVDWALILLDGQVDDVFADVKQVISAGDAEDHAKIVLRGSDGFVVDIEVTSACACELPEWVVMGQHGSLVGSSRRLEWKYYDSSQLPPIEVEEGTPERGFAGQDEEYPWIEGEWTPTEPPSPTGDFYAHLAKSIRGKQPFPVDPADVLLQMEILEKCRCLARQ